jgi:hypothetical protein
VGLHEPQFEEAVLLKVLPTEKAQADISFLTWVPWHSGHDMLSVSPKISFSNSWPHFAQWYS